MSYGRSYDPSQSSAGYGYESADSYGYGGSYDAARGSARGAAASGYHGQAPVQHQYQQYTQPTAHHHGHRGSQQSRYPQQAADVRAAPTAHQASGTWYWYCCQGLKDRNHTHGAQLVDLYTACIECGHVRQGCCPLRQHGQSAY